MKKTNALALLMLLAYIVLMLGSCITPELTLFTLKYTTSEGGTIQGETTQSVYQGEDGTAVVAIADNGYEFTSWSDGITTPFRKETNVQQNITVTAQFQKIEPILPTEYTVKYVSSTGGSIQGQTEQTVEQGKDAMEVTAVANEGYEFVKWSDNVTTTTRQDKAINNNITITAIFKEIEKPEPLTKTYSLNYNFGEAEDKPEQITFVENEIESITLPTLTREHFTFHGWYCGDEQIADTSGALQITDELLTKEETEIYAKWTANETFTYKILLVYVTRIDAILPHKDPSITEKIHVDYTMSEQEQEFCHLITLRTKKYLDKMLDGLVDFQVDEYYTTNTITTSDFHTAVGTTHESCLELKEVAEVKDILPQYDSGLILYDATKETAIATGQAGMRYGEVRLSSYRSALLAYNSSIEQAIKLMQNDDDLYLFGSTYLIDSYFIGPIVHELAHTIELRINLYSYHICLGDNIQGKITEFENNRRYYLHEIIIEGEKVGIPYEFWKRDIARCSYFVTKDDMGGQGYFRYTRAGAIPVPPGSGNRLFEVIYGEYITVTAIPHDGFRFKCWSDGLTTAERTDLITGDFTVTAIFEK